MEPIRKLIIMRGLPGSGKSTLAKAIFDGWNGSRSILSTDDYWKRPDGTYDFNRSLLPQAHNWNFKRFEIVLNAQSLWAKPALIIIDNTNVRKADYQKYVDKALSEGCTVEEVQPTTPWAWDVDTCFLRGTHSVPREAIQRMKDNFER